VRCSRELVFTVSALVSALACQPKESASAADSTTAAADTSSEPRSRMALPVAVTEARDGDLVLSVTTTGQVRSDGEATLRAEVAGTIDKVLVHPGDRVKRGQALVTFDRRPFDLSVEEADAGVAEAQVRYYDNIAPDSIVLKKAPSDEQRRIALARSGLQSARVRLERAKFDRDRANIVAPFDGMVDRVDHAPGERVTAGETITRVVDLSSLRIEASVLEHDLPLIKEGGQAIVTSAASPGQAVIGHVSAVLPMIDTTTRSGRAYMRLPPNSALRPGMYADVRLEAQRLTNRRLVPAAAVIERDGRPLVFVVKDGRAQWTYINPGRSNGRETEVLPDSTTGVIPINPGDEVIVEGHLTLTHDAPVRVVQAGDKARALDAGAGGKRP
jgi:membrane fusion protein, multidrug efflux system